MLEFHDSQLFSGCVVTSRHHALMFYEIVMMHYLPGSVFDLLPCYCLSVDILIHASVNLFNFDDMYTELVCFNLLIIW